MKGLRHFGSMVLCFVCLMAPMKNAKAYCDHLDHEAGGRDNLGPLIGTMLYSEQVASPYYEGCYVSDVYYYICSKCGEEASFGDSPWYNSHEDLYPGETCNRCGTVIPGGSITPTPAATAAPTAAPVITPEPTSVTATEHPTAAPDITAPPTEIPGACTHELHKEFVKQGRTPLNDEGHYSVATYRYYCDCGKYNYTEDEEAVYPHNLTGDRTGLRCICGYATAQGDYMLAVDQRHVYNYAGHEHICGSVGESIALQVYDKNDMNRDVRLEAEGIHVIVTGTGSADGLLCLLNESGYVHVQLIRNADGMELDALDIYVTVTDMNKNSEFFYDSDLSPVQLLSDMQAFDWKHNSMRAARDVYITDFVMQDNRMEFTAYNGQVLPYAVISYDAAGNEIDRAYIESKDSPNSMWSSFIDSVSTIGATLDGKFGNGSGTQKVEISLETVPGGYVSFVQPNQDMELMLLALVEGVGRLVDAAGATADAFTVVDVGKYQQIATDIGKDKLMSIMGQVITDAALDYLTQYKLPDTAENMQEAIWEVTGDFFSDGDAAEVIRGDYFKGVEDTATELLYGFSGAVMGSVEDYGLIALGPVTALTEKALDLTYAAVEADELRDLDALLDLDHGGEDLVTLDAILIPQ